MANGADNLFMQQRNSPAHQQKVTIEFYDTTGGIGNRLKQKYIHPTRPSIDVDVPSSIDRRPKFEKEPMTMMKLGDSSGKRKMSMESTEM